MAPLRLVAILFVVLSAGCSILAGTTDYPYEPRVFSSTAMSKASLAAWSNANGVLLKRCIVCHSCNDAPCQLKLTSIAGIDRGASAQDPYAVRLLEAPPTRLDIDASSTEGWRTKGFWPVLGTGAVQSSAPAEDPTTSVLYRMLALKQSHPLTSGTGIPQDLDFSLGRTATCPTPDSIQSYEEDHPFRGMPFGLPALAPAEHQALVDWIRHGALMPMPEDVPDDVNQAVLVWETFLNGTSNKERLMSRYLYEHIFLADLYFDSVTTQHRFRLVRSTTPSGQPIVVIPSRRPTDDPGVDTFYYRFQRNEHAPIAKSALPYPLNTQRMDRLRALFLGSDITVQELPTYEPKYASNPFLTFKDIPAANRYRFLLDDAKLFFAGFIKGPVCRGNLAVNVIEDRFWVSFLNPEKLANPDAAEFLGRATGDLSVPGVDDSEILLPLRWRRYADHEEEYLKLKREHREALARSNVKPDLSFIWDGGTEKNRNASLTVFRNGDNATVVHGFVGPAPKTSWVVGYPVFERIHYLLVADFDIFSNIGKQVAARLYMDFLRIEGENNFLAFLPESVRLGVHDNWYRGIGSDAHKDVMNPKNYFWGDTGISYQTQNPLQEFYQKLKQHLLAVQNSQYVLSPTVPAGVAQLAKLKGRSVSFLQEMSVLRVGSPNGKDELYTILVNRSHTNVAVLYDEDKRLIPEEDTLTVVPGLLGEYPNALFSVSRTDLGKFTHDISKLNSAQAYQKLVDTYGVGRLSSGFWSYSDWLQGIANAGEGTLDYNRLQR